MSHVPNHVRAGFGLRTEVRRELLAVYASDLVELLRTSDFVLKVDDLEIRLAREFGFCYGVDRAVEYAYETRKKFPDKRIFLTGEIIHNPHVNERLGAVGIGFLSGPRGVPEGLGILRPGDIVIVPAFGLPVEAFNELTDLGCTLVDTTCGSVLNVWKRVERYGREGFTSIIHGKHEHEETLATASRATYAGGRYLVVRDMTETESLVDFIEGRVDATEIERRFAGATSCDFEASRDLERIGLANQTTMLSSESLAIERRLRQVMEGRWGTVGVDDRFRSFDTICSATQDRQDAVAELCTIGVDRMLVIGGFNSSNTGHLVEIAELQTRAYHIEDAGALISKDEIVHQPHGAHGTEVGHDWLPDGPLRIGLTSGASTPNNRVGEVVERILVLRGIDPASIVKANLQPALAASVA